MAAAWRGRRERRWWLHVLVIMAIHLCFLQLSVFSGTTPASTRQSTYAVQVQSEEEQVVIDNGLVEVSFSKPDGSVTGIKYNGIQNLLETENKYNDRGYWDVVWNDGVFDRVPTTDFRIVTISEEQVEISFSKTWTSSDSSVPLNIDKRFIVRRGCPGLYFYAIMERGEGFPAADMYQIRIVFKLQNNKFRYMAISDDRQRVMPLAEDRDSDRSEILAYKEAVLLTNPKDPDVRGQVDDKYQYSLEDKDNRVHGWIANDSRPVGFWMITPSDEFRVAGPIKQDLTSHVGPITLNMFVSTHYAGLDLDTSYQPGETWKKVFGPALVYLNSGSPDEDPIRTLWEDAKRQMAVEVNNWPYTFPESKDFPKHDERGTVSGRLLVGDWGISRRLLWASGAYVGLAAPGDDDGSWQFQTKGYQFWTQVDRSGRFVIRNIRSGTYNLYGFVPGVIGDYKFSGVIDVSPGSRIHLGWLRYFPPRNGPTLWEIGIPDRTAAEFHIPDPYPTLLNPLYANLPSDRFRQYGIWARYSDIYRNSDLVYDVNESDYGRDWFYAHVTRDLGNNTYEATTWQIKFELPNVEDNGNYTLRLALASANQAVLQIRFNDPDTSGVPHFMTGRIGSDNAIARHGIHGLYRLYSIDVPSSRLQIGKNTIYLTQSMSRSPFFGVMYDYIRLEGPRP